MLDSVVTGVLNRSPRAEYLSPPAVEGAVLAGGTAVWVGAKLANPPFTAGAALTGALDIGKSEPVKVYTNDNWNFMVEVKWMIAEPDGKDSAFKHVGLMCYSDEGKIWIFVK